MSCPSLEELNLLHANICKAMGDPKRIQILYTLQDEPLHVSALAEALETPQPTISRHLAILRDRALVNAQREGAQVFYSLAAPEIIEILDNMRRLLRDVLQQQSQVVA
jgi:DNA-binding transcriptional ArsR family regulator